MALKPQRGGSASLTAAISPRVKPWNQDDWPWQQVGGNVQPVSSGVSEIELRLDAISGSNRLSFER